jgi:hypothetical protein
LTKPVGKTVDKGLFGPDDEEVRIEFLGRGDDRAGYSGVAWRDDHLGASGEDMCEGVLTTPGTDDADAHQAGTRSSGIEVEYLASGRTHTHHAHRYTGLFLNELQIGLGLGR